MDILILGGTRFLGRTLALRLLQAGHGVTVSSRRPEGAPDGVRVFPGERAAVLQSSALPRADLILDFTAYEACDVQAALQAYPTTPYLLISSCWVARLVRGAEAATPVDPATHAPASLPLITQRYLNRKIGAEAAVLAARQAGHGAAILRLPILVGAGDHTGRIDFFRRRIRDGAALILVNGGENQVPLLWVEDAAQALCDLLSNPAWTRHAILDGVPDQAVRVCELVDEIGRIEGRNPAVQHASSDDLAKRMPEHLETDPFWREAPLNRGPGNLFHLTGRATHAPAHWLRQLGATTAESDWSARDREQRFCLSITT